MLFQLNWPEDSQLILSSDVTRDRLIP